jgi:hypothetical protein
MSSTAATAAMEAMVAMVVNGGEGAHRGNGQDVDDEERGAPDER